ncbi:dnaJ homolog subfamily C member 7 homolog isoform X1 [Olea europaea subsp. europaea]|uniref:DnaJ homolog subfamily C member 7 homolog isoform X1 n=1 Tax=Olea europaea subsp. europaea TaxID=158383 RepID=A0A8S0TQE9_OLEEU|nr:dnaJ homolog subfamily C member 7 homolog isoform X1 [Olea europaea subsp. europaea]
MSKEEEDKRNTNNPFQQPNRGYQGKEEEEEMRLFGVLMFGLIGATATTLAVTKFRRTVDWVYSQLSRSRSSWNGSNGGSFRTSFQEEAWRRYNRRMREEYEEEMERVERIRRMQSVFNRERNKHQRKYESWAEHGSGAYHQHFQRNDWYWKADTSHRDRADNFRETGHNNAIAPLSHHYSILGLDRYGH